MCIANTLDMPEQVARALVAWVGSGEEAVSAAGMEGLDRHPGREAAAQGLVQLWGGADGESDIPHDTHNYLLFL